MRYPLALPAVALVIGVAAGIFLPAYVFPIVRAAILAGWIGALLAAVRRRRAGFLLCVLLAFISIGWASASHASASARNTPLRRLFDQEKARTHQRDVFAIVEGILREDAAVRPWGATLSVRVDRILTGGRDGRTAGGLRASVTGELLTNHLESWRRGRRVRFPVWLQRPSHYLNPGVPDDEVLLAWRGIALVGSVKSAVLVEVRAHGGWADEWGAAARQLVRRAVRQSVGRWDQQSASIITAILIGDRSGLDEALQQRLQRAGTYHVIAISGGNIAILAALLLWGLRRLRVAERLATCATIALLIAYWWLIGPQSSVSRATLMAVVYLAGVLLDQRANPVNTLALVVVVILLAAPLSLADAGLWLTCGATLALILVAGRVQKQLPARIWLRAPAALFAASVCAEAALFPVAAFVFSRVTFAGLVLNFAAIPLMTLGQAAGMAVVSLAVIHAPLADAFGWLAHVGAWGLADSAQLVEWAPWLSYRLPAPVVPAIAIYYGALTTWLFAATDQAQAMWPNGRAVRLRRAAASASVAAAAWILVEPISATVHVLGLGRTLRVTFIDVGQGDSTLVQFPGGHSLLVDAGAGTDTFDLGGRIVAPVLWAARVRHLNTMEITHGDTDHIGGALSVARDFSPHEIWYGVPVPPHVVTRALRARTERVGAVWRTLQAGDQVEVGGAVVRAWHPPEPDWERQDVRNDDSVVIEIRFGEVSIVLPGDISREVEHAIAPNFEPAGFRLLKAAHHGSATSSSAEFLDALHPTAVVFSCGRDNTFGHPAPSVIRRYQQIGATLLRTDEDGAISLETDGRSVTLSTYGGKRLRWRVS